VVLGVSCDGVLLIEEITFKMYQGEMSQQLFPNMNGMTMSLRAAEKSCCCLITRLYQMEFLQGGKNKDVIPLPPGRAVNAVQRSSD